MRDKMWSALSRPRIEMSYINVVYLKIIIIYFTENVVILTVKMEVYIRARLTVLELYTLQLPSAKLEPIWVQAATVFYNVFLGISSQLE